VRKAKLKGMQRTVRATYEGGVLHPLDPLLLQEHQRVTVTVSDDAELPTNHPLFVSPDEWADAAHEEIALDDVRDRLSRIKGSVSQLIIDERRDR
jgi:predicted DNA-binding antitoxin AbrB/MazE fold protein